MPSGVMPRSVTLIPCGASTLSRSITVTISSEAIGWPEFVRAMPFLNFMSWKLACVTTLISSAVPPLRRTRTCSGFPEDWSDVRSPPTSARIASSTATVSPMPSAVMTVVVFLTTRFLRL